MIGKAHSIEVLTDPWGRGYHRPICGAQIGHLAERCVPAPTGWPACRHCSRRPRDMGVPLVFYGLEAR